MKKKLFFIAVMMLSFSIEANATQFIEGLEDIPLMDELQQRNDENIAFGNEESRFIEAYLTGNVKFSKVEDFYISTLPQLGWSFEGKNGNTLFFYRDNDVIEIVKERNSPLLVRITLKSKG